MAEFFFHDHLRYILLNGEHWRIVKKKKSLLTVVCCLHVAIVIWKRRRNLILTKINIIIQISIEFNTTTNNTRRGEENLFLNSKKYRTKWKSNLNDPRSQLEWRVCSLLLILLLIFLLLYRLFAALEPFFIIFFVPSFSHSRSVSLIKWGLCQWWWSE